MMPRLKAQGTSFTRALRVVAAALALSMALPRLAPAMEVRGRVSGHEHLRNPVWSEARQPQRHGYSFREPISTVPANLRKLFPVISRELCVVAIAQTPQRAGKAVPVRVAGGRTTPGTLVVAPGTELRFENGDPFEHRLYGVGFDSFPPSTIAKGGTRRWTVKGTGSFELRDELSPSVRSWVVTDPGVAGATYPDSDGRFALSVDEAGVYEVQAFFAGKKVGRPIVVTVGRRNVDLKGRTLVVATKAPKESKSP